MFVWVGVLVCVAGVRVGGWLGVFVWWVSVFVWVAGCVCVGGWVCLLTGSHICQSNGGGHWGPQRLLAGNNG